MGKILQKMRIVFYIDYYFLLKFQVNFRLIFWKMKKNSNILNISHENICVKYLRTPFYKTSPVAASEKIESFCNLKISLTKLFWR